MRERAHPAVRTAVPQLSVKDVTKSYGTRAGCRSCPLPIRGSSPRASPVDADLYSDFELVTSGPVEWDLAALGPVHESAYDRGAQRNGTRLLNEDVLRFVNAVGMLRVIASLTLVPQLPELVEYLRPAVEQWQTMPFAGGMTG